MKEFHFISETHLGDCLLHAHFLNCLVEKNNNIKVFFYILDKHKHQTEQFIKYKSNIICLKYNDAPHNSLRGWVGQFGVPKIPFNLCELRLFSYKKLCQLHLNLQCPFNSTIDLLPKFDNVNKATDTWDILLINSNPLSNQITEPIGENEFISKFKKYKIITTRKVHNLPCTMDYNYTVFDIGLISLNINKIIGINTGPWFSVMNMNNYTKNKTLYYIDENCKFNYSNCINIKNLKVFL